MAESASQQSLALGNKCCWCLLHFTDLLNETQAHTTAGNIPFPQDNLEMKPQGCQQGE